MPAARNIPRDRRPQPDWPTLHADGALTAGFTTGRAEADAARKGAYAAQTISASAPALARATVRLE